MPKCLSRQAPAIDNINKFDRKTNSYPGDSCISIAFHNRFLRSIITVTDVQCNTLK